MANRLNRVKNRSLLYDVYPYVWDMCGVVGLLNSYVDWLGTHTPPPLPHHPYHTSPCPGWPPPTFPYLSPLLHHSRLTSPSRHYCYPVELQNFSPPLFSSLPPSSFLPIPFLYPSAPPPQFVLGGAEALDT